MGIQHRRRADGTNGLLRVPTPYGDPTHDAAGQSVCCFQVPTPYGDPTPVGRMTASGYHSKFQPLMGIQHVTPNTLVIRPFAFQPLMGIQHQRAALISFAFNLVPTPYGDPTPALTMMISPRLAGSNPLWGSNTLLSFTFSKIQAPNHANSSSYVAFSHFDLQGVSPYRRSK